MNCHLSFGRFSQGPLQIASWGREGPDSVIHKDSDEKIQNRGQVHPTGRGPGGANGQAPAGLANPKEKHGSIIQQTHHLQEESSGTDELWIGGQAKAGPLALQFPADESGN